MTKGYEENMTRGKRGALGSLILENMFCSRNVVCFLFFFFVCVKLFFVFVISIKFKVMLNTLHLHFQKSLSCSAIYISLKSVKGYRSIVK